MQGRQILPVMLFLSCHNDVSTDDVALTDDYVHDDRLHYPYFDTFSCSNDLSVIHLITKISQRYNFNIAILDNLICYSLAFSEKLKQ